MDYNNIMGVDKRMWIYFYEMEFCIGGNLSVWLKFFLESSSSIVDVFVDDDFEESGDDED